MRYLKLQLKNKYFKFLKQFLIKALLFWCLVPLSIASVSAAPQIISYRYFKPSPSIYSHALAIVPYNSAEGKRRLDAVKDKNTFLSLTPYYKFQEHLLGCGVTSAIIILNAVYGNLYKQPPLSKSGSLFMPEENLIEGHFIWSEDNFFNSKLRAYLNPDLVYGKVKLNGNYVVGMTLEQVTHALKLHGLSAQKFPVNRAGAAEIRAFRQLLRKVMVKPSYYIIVNYNFNFAAESSLGHISPLAAYDEHSDSVLLMDTWTLFGSWIWVKLEDFYKSMNTRDGDQFRGYVLIAAYQAK
jgi:hypothetical protein